MKGMNRRNFIKNGSVLTAGVSFFGFSKGLLASPIPPKKNSRVVVIGGGFGGCTAAKYIKMYDPSIEVVLIEKDDKFVSCPISNLVIVNLKGMDFITFSYDNLVKNYGIKFIKAEVLGIDEVKKHIITSGGNVEYDKVVVSPGIGFVEDESIGYSLKIADKVTHAWKAGKQTETLKYQLQNLPKGSAVLLRVPKTPYRCPPGPYERASLIADYLKKNKKGSKVIVLDANDDVTSKGKLFKAAWSDLYRDELEYVSQVEVNRIGVEDMSIDTNKGKIKGGVINFIPDQKAADLAFKLGLVPIGKSWVPVDSYTFESELKRDIYVIGDSTNTGSVGTVPKSGYVANSMGKVVAESVVASFKGVKPPKPFMINACYSMVSSSEAIWVTAVYEYDESSRRTLQIKDSGGTPSARSPLYALHQISWAHNIWDDTLG